MPDNKWTPPSDAVEVKGWTPPSDAIELSSEQPKTEGLAQPHEPIGVLAPKTKPSPYLKGLDFKSVTDAVKADKGKQEQNNSSLGALYNFAVGSLSKLGSGALARAAQSVPSSMGSVGGAPSGTNAISTEERNKAAIDLGGAASDFIEKARSESSSKENEASKEFDLSKGVGHNIAALGYQIPALGVDLGSAALTGGGSFFAQGEGSAIQELKNNPEASKLTPNQAAGYVMTQGTINGLLMKLGFDKIFKSTGISDLVGKKIASEVTSELIDKGVKATTQDIQDLAFKKATAFMNKAKNVGIKAAMGTATGAGVGALQTASSDAIKLLSDKASGKDVFNDEDIKKNFGHNLLNSVVQGGLTGAALSTAHGTLENTNKAIRLKIAEAHTPEDVANVKQNINEEVEKGNITQEEADAAGIKAEDYAQIAAKIPSEVSPEKKYAIIGGIEQREALKNQIQSIHDEANNVDESFRKDKLANIDLLNGKLGQVNDYIESLVTDTKPKYEKDGDVHYKVDEDGNKTPITKEHYELAKEVQKENNKKPQTETIPIEENKPTETIPNEQGQEQHTETPQRVNAEQAEAKGRVDNFVNGLEETNPELHKLALADPIAALNKLIDHHKKMMQGTNDATKKFSQSAIDKFEALKKDHELANGKIKELTANNTILVGNTDLKGNKKEPYHYTKQQWDNSETPYYLHGTSIPFTTLKKGSYFAPTGGEHIPFGFAGGNMNREHGRMYIEHNDNLETSHAEEGEPFKLSKGELTPKETIPVTNDTHKYLVKKALNDGSYSKDIADGKISANDAKTIIESAGLEVPKDILELASKEKTTPTIKEEVKGETKTETPKVEEPSKEEAKSEIPKEVKDKVKEVVDKHTDISDYFDREKKGNKKAITEDDLVKLDEPSKKAAEFKRLSKENDLFKDLMGCIWQ